MTAGYRTDLLAGLSTFGRLKREREDAAYIAEHADAGADPEALKIINNTFAGRNTGLKAFQLRPWRRGEIPSFIVCARLDLDHPLYFADNLIGQCEDCGCDVQWRPSVPKAPKLCVCCAARRTREEDA